MTLDDILEEIKEAENIIKEGKIEDVLFYFEKLSKEEKAECIDKLKTLV
jgi:hypothetical protein